ncbi:AglZ/HisF2 family acetamidino modification protein [Thermodesulfobacteriota bacterium]
MLFTRVIPCLLLKNKGLVKTVKFKKPKYVGDPINAIKIFNEKEVDEMIFLDIDASIEKRGPNFKVIEEIASECFMPLCYGGGIRNTDDIKRIFSTGVEKVALNTQALKNANMVKAAADIFGSQSIVVSIDAKRNMFRKYDIYGGGGRIRYKTSPPEYAARMEKMGAGEIMINSIDRDGTMVGYDLYLVKSVSDAVSIPVIACGGAGKKEDFSDAVKKAGATAVAAGSFFVFHGKHRAVLITYPSLTEIKLLFD